MADHESRTEISSIGEFGLIEHLTSDIELHHAASQTGVGDDAAVILGAAGDDSCVTTDMLVEGVHFDLTYCPLKHLGYKAVTVNISDLCAMGAEPRQITVALAISNRFSVEALDELYSGIKAACARYQVDLVGGDTCSSHSGLVICITAIGVVKEGKAVLRSGAGVHDLICVSGDLGAAYLGLQILEREKMVFKANPMAQPQLDKYDYVLERQLKPEPRTDVVAGMNSRGVIPTSMIDISDGLASELLHICKASHLGCAIYEEKIPITFEAKDVASELNLNPTTCALNGGEDYELLFTVRQSDYDKIKDFELISVIGHMTDAGAGTNLVTEPGQIIPLRAQGWDAFSKNEK